MLSIVSLVLGLFWTAQTSTTAAAVGPQQALVSQYCVTCHNEKTRTAGIVLEKLDVQRPGANAEIWEKAVQQLRARSMPPANMPRPDKATYDGFRIWLENELDKYGTANPNPGSTVTYHRLNRAEYQNAIRDLLAVDIDATAFLPEDPASFGFDNMGGAIKMSTDLLETYMKAAMRISRDAIGTTASPQLTTYKLEDDQAQDDRNSDLPFGTRGGTEAKHYF